jgi:hypothetical protein
VRDYSQFKSSFWTGETGKALRNDPEAQRLAAYLFTSPHHNIIGFYWLPVLYASREIGMPEEVVREALTRLSDMGFAHYDATLELVWVVNMAREQLGLRGERLSDKDNRGKAARRAAETVKRSPMYQRFFAMYGEALGLPFPATPSKGGSEPPSKGRTTASEEQKGIDIEQNRQEGRTRAGAPDAGASSPASDPETPLASKPRRADEAKSALKAALKASFRASGDIAPEVSDGVAAKAAKRVRELVDGGHAPDLGDASKRLVEAARRSGKAFPWCLLDASPLRGTQPAVGRPVRLAQAPGTTAADFEDCEDVETQLARWGHGGG